MLHDGVYHTSPIFCAQHIIDFIAQELYVDIRINICYGVADGPRPWLHKCCYIHILKLLFVVVQSCHYTQNKKNM